MPAEDHDDHGAGVADVEVKMRGIVRRVLQPGLAMRAFRERERVRRAVLPVGRHEADQGAAGEVAVPVGRERVATGPVVLGRDGQPSQHRLRIAAEGIQAKPPDAHRVPRRPRRRPCGDGQVHVGAPC